MGYHFELVLRKIWKLNDVYLLISDEQQLSQNEEVQLSLSRDCGRLWVKCGMRNDEGKMLNSKCGTNAIGRDV